MIRVLVHVAALAALGCVGSTPPAPSQSTTTITAADLRGGEVEREAVVARAERRLVVAAREIGVLQRELSRRPPETTRAARQFLRGAEQRRATLEHDLSRLASSPEASWSPEERTSIDTRLDELDALLEQARK